MADIPDLSDNYKKLKFQGADKANFEKIMDEINGYMNWHKDHDTPPSISELDQFHKSWFYNNWLVRFRQLKAFSNLGDRGVIAIPNTTFEEWLWWFHEWAEALTDDYNQFKQMMYEALMMIQKHLDAIDKILEDHEKRLQDHERRLQDHERRIQKLEKEMQEVKQAINDINNTIDNMKNDINKRFGDINKQMGDINNKYNNLNKNLGGNTALLNKIINKLTEAGAWDPNSNDFKPGMGIACGNINLFGGQADGGSWIRTNGGSSENDITAGI